MPEKLYLDLIKKTLTFSLWSEPLIPLEVFNHRCYRRGLWKRLIVSALSSLLKLKGLHLCTENNFSEWPVFADTMIGIDRLDNIQFCIESIIKEGIEGDFIETGVWRGGACIFMRAVLAAYGVEDRKVFVADSFEGLPKPDTDRYPEDSGDIHFTHKFLAVSQKEVEHNFRKYGLLDEKVVFLKGFFADTLSKTPIVKLSILRLDGDMYSSTIEVLNSLYPKLSSGGYCIIDDYGLSGCKKAVENYRIKHNITAEIKDIDSMSIYWKK